MRVSIIYKTKDGRIESILCYGSAVKIRLNADKLEVHYKKLPYDQNCYHSFDEDYYESLSVSPEQMKQIEEDLLNGKDVVIQQIVD